MAGDWRDFVSGALGGAASGLMLSQLGAKGSADPEAPSPADEVWCTIQGGTWTGTECVLGGQVITKSGIPANRQFNNLGLPPSR